MADPCEGKSVPTPEIDGLKSARFLGPRLWLGGADFDGSPDSTLEWQIRVTLPDDPIQVMSYTVEAIKEECWTGETDGACDLQCRDTVVVEIIDFDETCVRGRMTEADDGIDECVDFADAPLPFSQILAVDGGLLAERVQP